MSFADATMEELDPEGKFNADDSILASALQKAYDQGYRDALINQAIENLRLRKEDNQ